MKKNMVLMPVDPKFRELLKIEAKTKGMSMTRYTQELVSQDAELDKIAEGWKGKYKTIRHEKRGFDFL